MHVTLDGTPAAFGWSGCATLGALLERAEAACRPQGLAIIGLTVGGEALDLADRPSWSSRDLHADAEVAIRTLSLRLLAEETLDELRAHLPALRRDLEAAASCLRSGKEKEALEALDRVATLWQGCLEGADSAASALGARAALEPLLERLRMAIGPLDEALRRRDLVLVADLCAYELPPLVDQWEQALKGLGPGGTQDA